MSKTVRKANVQESTSFKEDAQPSTSASVDLCVISCLVESFYTIRKEIPTLKKILKIGTQLSRPKKRTNEGVKYINNIFFNFTSRICICILHLDFFAISLVFMTSLSQVRRYFRQVDYC